MKSYQHIIFWIAVHASLTLVFGNWFEDYVEAFYYVSLLFPVVMATSYFFNYYLVPRYLFTRRFFSFGLYSIYMLVVSLCLELLASVVSMLLIIRFRGNETAALVTDVFTLAVILYFIVLFKSFILLIKHYFIDQHSIRQMEEAQTRLEQGYLTVRSRRKTSRIDYERLVYIESLSDYIRIHLDDGEEVVSKEKISHVSDLLPDGFLRIHRSFIVNTVKIDSFSSEAVLLGDVELPVSRTYRSEVIRRLKKH